MTDFEHEHQVPVTAYGDQRKADWLTDQQAKADMMNEMLSGAGRAGHQAEHDIITRSKQGLFGAMTPEELGQAAAERQATVGGEWGQARPLERNGGLFDHHVTAPHPAQRDLRYVNQVQRPSADSVSPLKAFMDGR
jgi:hypothetical protein